MFYIGCIPLLALVVLIVVFSLIKGMLNTLGDIVIGAYLTFKEYILKFFRPTPIESEIENFDYYNDTQLREKLYDKGDGEYVSFKEIR